MTLNAASRLTSLANHTLLGSAAEERFDRITRITQHLFDVPIALISLVDQGQFWVKSAIGMKRGILPTDHSFCRYTLSSKGAFVIEDAIKDPRFLGHPMVINSPFVRFYAGYPLSTDEGTTIGSLCIFDQKPRSFSEERLHILRDLAGLAEQQFQTDQTALEDALSKVPSRLGFMQSAKLSLELCRRARAKAIMICLDIQQFKDINRDYGHEEGDRLLAQIGEELKNCLGANDICGRLRSDAFMVLLSHSSPEQAKKMIQQLHLKLNSALTRYSVFLNSGIIEIGTNNRHHLEALMAQTEDMMIEEKAAQTPARVLNHSPSSS